MPPGFAEAVVDVIKALEQAETAWQAELVVSELVGRRWFAFPIGQAYTIDVNVRMAAEEAAEHGGRGRTLQAVLGHLTGNQITQARINLASRALGVLQPWVALLDTVELIEAREAPGLIVLHFGYLDGIDQHYIVVTHDDGIIQRVDVGPDAPEAEPVDPRDLAPRLATLMVLTTWHVKKVQDLNNIDPAWALLMARVQSCLPPVLTLMPMLPDRAKSLKYQFGRLKAAKELADKYDTDTWWVRETAAQAIEYERRNCPGGWTVDDVHTYFRQEARKVHPDEEEQLEQILIAYLDWRMGKRGYPEVVEAARVASFTMHYL